MWNLKYLAFVFFPIVAIWIVLICFLPSFGKQSLFFQAGRYPLWDHRNFRRVVETAQPYLANEGILREDGAEIIRQDVCYPALAILLVKSVPDTMLGDCVFVGLGAAFYLIAAVVFVRKYSDGVPLLVASLLTCAAPFLFAVQVGNMITYAAAAVLMYLAWYDDGSRTKRLWAVVFFSLAGTLKVSPVLLGMMYLGKGWRKNVTEIILAALLSLVFLLVPFVWNGGIPAFVAWLENAVSNSRAYAQMNEFGIYGICSSWLRMIGYLHETPAWVMRLARGGSVIVALLCLIYGGGGLFARTRFAA